MKFAKIKEVNSIFYKKMVEGTFKEPCPPIRKTSDRSWGDIQDLDARDDVVDDIETLPLSDDEKQGNANEAIADFLLASGITDEDRIELIADYFIMVTESLDRAYHPKSMRQLGAARTAIREKIARDQAATLVRRFQGKNRRAIMEYLNKTEELAEMVVDKTEKEFGVAVISDKLRKEDPDIQIHASGSQSYIDHWQAITQHVTEGVVAGLEMPKIIAETSSVIIPRLEKGKKTFDNSQSKDMKYFPDILALLKQLDVSYNVIIGRHFTTGLGNVFFIIEPPYNKMIIARDNGGTTFIVHGSYRELPWLELANLTLNELKRLRAVGLVSEVEQNIKKPAVRIQEMRRLLSLPNPNSLPSDITEFVQQPLKPLDHEPYPLVELERRFGGYRIKEKVAAIMKNLMAESGVAFEDALLEEYRDSRGRIDHSYPQEVADRLAREKKEYFQDEQWLSYYQVWLAVIKELTRRGRPIDLARDSVYKKLQDVEKEWEMTWSAEKGPYKQKRTSRSSKGSEESDFIIRELANAAVPKIVGIYMDYRKQPSGMVTSSNLGRILWNKGYRFSEEDKKRALADARKRGLEYTEMGLGGRNQEIVFYKREFADFVIANGFAVRKTLASK